MKLTAQQRAIRLQLYGLVQSLSYVVRLNDLKTAQHFRARLAWVLRRPHDLARPLHGDLSSLLKNPRHGESVVIHFCHKSAEAGMRGTFVDQGGLFSYI